MRKIQNPIPRNQSKDILHINLEKKVGNRFTYRQGHG